MVEKYSDCLAKLLPEFQEDKQDILFLFEVANILLQKKFAATSINFSRKIKNTVFIGSIENSQPDENSSQTQIS